MRTVTVFSTKGSRRAKIETDVTTWGELRSLVEKEGYDVDKLHATENIRRTDLTHKDAVLPMSAFTLFMRPKKTKSGGNYDNMGFTQLRGELDDEDKSIISEQTGKNWTQCSTEDLRNYLNSKTPGTSSPEQVVEQEVIGEEVVEVSEETSERINEINSLLDNISQKVNEQISEVKEKINNLANIEDLVEKAKLQAEAEILEKAEQEEIERLLHEADDLMSGF